MSCIHWKNMKLRGKKTCNCLEFQNLHWLMKRSKGRIQWKSPFCLLNSIYFTDVTWDLSVACRYLRFSTRAVASGAVAEDGQAIWPWCQSFYQVPGMGENSEKPQFLVSSDTFAKPAGALAQTEGVKLWSPAVNAEILNSGVPSLILNLESQCFSFHKLNTYILIAKPNPTKAKLA